jgi:phage gp45-like
MIDAQTFRNLARRVSNLFVWGVVLRDADGVRDQRHQVAGRAGETFDGVVHLLPYGFVMRVLPPGSGGQGAEELVIAIDRDHRVALPAIDRRYRPEDLAAGEVALYSDEDALAGGCRIHLKRGQEIEITCVDAKVTAANGVRVEAGNDVTVEGANDVRVQGGENVRLEGKNVEIHATERLALDCLGHGEEWLPTHKVSWTGTATGEGLDISPPEIGDSRDE